MNVDGTLDQSDWIKHVGTDVTVTGEPVAPAVRLGRDRYDEPGSIDGILD